MLNLNMKFVLPLIFLVAVLTIATSGCTSLPSDVNSKVGSCMQSGSFDGNNYCSEALCPNGRVGYLSAITCLGELAKNVSKTDKNSAEAICDRIYQITKNQFSDMPLLQQSEADTQKSLCLSDLK
jgi:hypothetical protein